MSIIIVDRFSPTTAKLRSHFEKTQSDDHTPDRFSWDFWHKEGRYRLLRTPATKYFPQPLFEKIESEIRLFGEKYLGCRALSPLWLSCYIDGCEQRWHADRPHGPWAFVLSLSPSRLPFQGGETMILKSTILNYWDTLSRMGEQSFEDAEVVDRISPRFNRLTVFDPRIPHGVSMVEGPMDPMKGRLVLHGWFTQPRPHYLGPLSPKKIEAALSAFDGFLGEAISELMNEGQFSSSGTVAYRIQFGPSGRLLRVLPLAHTLSAALPEVADRDHHALTNAITSHFRSNPLPPAKTGSTLTLPLTFSGGLEGQPPP